MGRVLAIDYGEKRVGLARSDPDRVIATGMGHIENTSTADVIRRVVERLASDEVEEIVVGFPLTLAGEKGPAALEVERFAGELGAATDVPVVLWDERLSTAQAEKALLSSGMRRSKRKKKRDRTAAQIILASYLSATNRRGG